MENSFDFMVFVKLFISGFFAAWSAAEIAKVNR